MYFVNNLSCVSWTKSTYTYVLSLSLSNLIPVIWTFDFMYPIVVNFFGFIALSQTGQKFFTVIFAKSNFPYPLGTQTGLR